MVLLHHTMVKNDFIISPLASFSDDEESDLDTLLELFEKLQYDKITQHFPVTVSDGKRCSFLSSHDV